MRNHKLEFGRKCSGGHSVGQACMGMCAVALARRVTAHLHRCRFCWKILSHQDSAFATFNRVELSHKVKLPAPAKQ